jgi:thioredoxin-like negative regulator of GroEL
MQVPAKEVALMMEVGHLCRYARRFREAQQIFQGVGALLPARDIADLGLAAVACDELKFEEAERLCRRILQADSRNVAAYAQLAEVQIGCNDIASAKNTLKTARDLRPVEPLASLISSLQRLVDLLQKLQHAETPAPVAR